MPKPFTSTSVAETEKWGVTFGKGLKKNSIIAFYGSLGAGKTTLIKAIVKGALDNEHIRSSSPTFVYLNEYQVEDKAIYHFDLYRLREAEDFIECGFEEFFYRGGICLIEWAERIEELLPKHALQLRMKSINQTTREILIENG